MNLQIIFRIHARTPSRDGEAGRSVTESERLAEGDRKMWCHAGGLALPSEPQGAPAAGYLVERGVRVARVGQSGAGAGPAPEVLGHEPRLAVQAAVQRADPAVSTAHPQLDDRLAELLGDVGRQVDSALSSYLGAVG